MKTITNYLNIEHLLLVIILLLTFLLRFPSLFEPFWYGDEGIFAAVARNLNLGGVLYETAWDNKPPMIYLTYQAIFNVFGVSMFWLRLVTIIAVLTTAAIIYEVAQVTIGVKKGFILTIGFLIPYTVAVLYFAPKNLLNDYIFAAYTYYQIYLDESPQYQIFINISKILPIVAAVGYGIWQKYKLKKVEVTHLFFLWAAFSLLGSYFSGRTYGHYLVQAVPAVSLLIASISLPVKLNKARIVFAVAFFVPLLILTRLLFSDFLTGGPINQVKYWQNFTAFAYGNKGLSDYNDFFDRNVNTIMALADSIEKSGSRGKTIYIWGDYPWLYAVVDAWNPSRYVTSFHVFGVPDGPEEVTGDLNANLPDLIIKPEHSIGYFKELEMLVATRYTLIAKVETAEVFRLR